MAAPEVFSVNPLILIKLRPERVIPLLTITVSPVFTMNVIRLPAEPLAACVHPDWGLALANTVQVSPATDAAAHAEIVVKSPPLDLTVRAVAQESEHSTKSEASIFKA
jgi:hypothetical protein